MLTFFQFCEVSSFNFFIKISFPLKHHVKLLSLTVPFYIAEIQFTYARKITVVDLFFS